MITFVNYARLRMVIADSLSINDGWFGLFTDSRMKNQTVPPISHTNISRHYYMQRRLFDISNWHFWAVLWDFHGKKQFGAPNFFKCACFNIHPWSKKRDLVGSGNLQLPESYKKSVGHAFSDSNQEVGWLVRINDNGSKRTDFWAWFFQREVVFSSSLLPEPRDFSIMQYFKR